jgi:hypothetical protein
MSGDLTCSSSREQIENVKFKKRINVFFTETTRDRKQIMDEYSFDGPGL